LQLYKTKYVSEISDDVTELGRKFIPKWSGRDCMLVGFTITYAISAYHHLNCEFESRSWRGVLDTILCDKICQ